MDFNALMSLAPLWERLGNERRPILLYGTGNGADKILDVMEARSIPCAGVFASDGFVRERDFRSMRVTSYSDAIARFGEDVVILVAFGSPREEVLSFIGSLAARHTVYIPDVPLFCDDLGSELFTVRYALAHREQIERAASLFEESESRKLYWETLAYRLSGDMKYLARTEPFEKSVAACLPRDISRVIDGGAFTGDTARIFLDELTGVKKVVCVEPDPRTFRRLSAFAGEDGRVTAINASLGETAGTDAFASRASRASASRSSAPEGQDRRRKTVQVDRVTVDLLTGRGGDSSDVRFGAAAGEGRLLIKLDVEGAETAALRGARLTLAAERPALAAALYHRTADLFEIPLALADHYPDGAFRLRRARCVPGWELTMFVL